MTIVLCHGVFDMLHAGHVEHLRQARAMGDFLIVSVVPDRFVTKPGRPIYKEAERITLLRAMKGIVDLALLCGAPGPEFVILEVRPNLYVRGSEYRGKTMPEDDVLRDLGVEVRYTESVPPTTTQILQRIGCALHSS